MPTIEIITDEAITSLINHASDLLRLSLLEIETRYSNCFAPSIKSVDSKYENAIDIRFNKEQFTFTCLFGNNNQCLSVCLFPDTEILLNRFMCHLAEIYDYDFLRNRWLLSNCFLQSKALTDVKGIEESICLKMYL